MVQEVINVGAFANDGTGDPLRTALIKTNNNFSQLFGNLNSSDVYQTHTVGANLTLAPGTGNVVIANNAAIVANLTNFTTMYANNATFNGQITTNTVYPIIGNLSGTASQATLATTAIYATTAGTAINAQNFVGNNLPNVFTIGNLISVNVGIANIGTLNSNSNIYATGNIVAGSNSFVLGNGYYLSGLSVGPASYGNSNVAAYLAVYTGNVNANYVFSNTISSVFGTNGNLNLIPDGSGDVVSNANLWIKTGYLRTTAANIYLSNTTPSLAHIFGNAKTLLIGNSNATTTIPGNVIIGQTANVGANLNVTGNVSGNNLVSTYDLIVGPAGTVPLNNATAQFVDSSIV